MLYTEATKHFLKIQLKNHYNSIKIIEQTNIYKGIKFEVNLFLHNKKQSVVFNINKNLSILEVFFSPSKTIPVPITSSPIFFNLLSLAYITKDILLLQFLLYCLLLFLVFFAQVSLCSPGCPQGKKKKITKILLPQPPNCWDDR